MLVTLWWWLISNVDGNIIMLTTFFVMLVVFSMYWIGPQHPESVTNISNLSPTHLVSNIRHQYRCNRLQPCSIAAVRGSKEVLKRFYPMRFPYSSIRWSNNKLTRYKKIAATSWLYDRHKRPLCDTKWNKWNIWWCWRTIFYENTNWTNAKIDSSIQEKKFKLFHKE